MEKTIAGLVAACALAGLGVGVASAGSINIDFGTLTGTPSDGFAGAGTAGYWNGVSVGDASSFSLLDTSGSATGATLFALDLAGSLDVSGSGLSPDAPVDLLGDYAYGSRVTSAFSVDGLDAGMYEVIVYVTYRQDFPVGSTVNIRGNERSATGEYQGGFVEGETHTRHEVMISDGLLYVQLNNPLTPVVNGVQIRAIPAPSGLVCLGIGGLVAVRRRRG